MAHETESPNTEDDHGRIDRWELIRIGGTAVFAAAVWFHVWEPFHPVSVVGLLGVVIGGWPIFHEAWKNIRQRRMTMELSMTIALLSAVLIGEFFTALMIATFVLVAEVLEGLTVGRGRRAIRDLLDLLPATATIRRSGTGIRIPLAQVKIGDAVLVAPGERIPVDGTVQGGDSYVDQATITGESMPVRKIPGSPVYAGTINQSGALELAADRLGRDTSFGKIIEAVERAERSQAPVEKTADRYAGYLVYFALACAAVTFALTRDARSTISVIIVAGACGIAAGTPLAILGAIGRAARTGAIIKGGRYLETLWRIDVVAFDKTGTVTIGAPEVLEIRPTPGVSDRTLLEAAAVAERRSEHPLARAVIQRADALGIPPIEPTAFSYVPGRGIIARTPDDEILVGSRAFACDRRIEGCPGTKDDFSTAATEIVVARGGTCLGTILIADTVRPEARSAMRHLRRLGIQTVLLTGDVRAVGEAVGRDLQVDDVRAELLPEQKVAAVRELRAAGKTVAMVGDGVNDAPALVEAAVGVAMGSGTDVARESANIVLLGNDLSKFAETVDIAKRAHGIIQFNFVGTLTVDAIGVALAAFGLLNPLLAAFIHVASELTFILNSARLLPGRTPALPLTKRVAAEAVAPAA